MVDKFYGIRQQALEGFEDASWDDKCVRLLRDPEEIWSYNDTSTSNYIVSFHLLRSFVSYFVLNGCMWLTGLSYSR